MSTVLERYAKNQAMPAVNTCGISGSNPAHLIQEAASPSNRDALRSALVADRVILDCDVLKRQTVC